MSHQALPRAQTSARLRPPGARRSGWFHSLRWRLIFVYAGLLAVILLGLGLVLNLVIGRVLYSNELTAFQTEARAVVGTSQRAWDALVRGQPADHQPDGDRDGRDRRSTGCCVQPEQPHLRAGAGGQ